MEGIWGALLGVFGALAGVLVGGVLNYLIQRQQRQWALEDQKRQWRKEYRERELAKAKEVLDDLAREHYFMRPWIEPDFRTAEIEVKLAPLTPALTDEKLRSLVVKIFRLAQLWEEKGGASMMEGGPHTMPWEERLKYDKEVWKLLSQAYQRIEELSTEL
jgi:hypothetical protein